MVTQSVGEKVKNIFMCEITMKAIFLYGNFVHVIAMVVLYLRYVHLVICKYDYDTPV